MHIISQWILVPDAETEVPTSHIYPKLRVIFGYAAQGKTSFCYRLMYKLIEEDKIKRPVFFFRLRELNTENLDEFRENPFKVLMDKIRIVG